MARAQVLRYAALAVTDEGLLSGVVRAHAEVKRLGLFFIVGATLQLAPRSASASSVFQPVAPATAPATPATPAALRKPDRPDPPGPRLVLLAQSRRGYGNLAQWITVARRRAPKGEYRALMSDLEGRVPELPTLAGLPDCFALLMASTVLPAAGSGEEGDDDRAPADAATLAASAFDTLFAQAM